MSMLPSRLLECTRKVPPPPLRPGQVEPFLSPTRAIFQPLWGKTRAERGECPSIFPPPARGRCAAKRSLPPTLLARSSGQEDAILRRGRLLPGTSRPIWWTVILGPGSLLVVHYLDNFRRDIAILWRTHWKKSLPADGVDAVSSFVLCPETLRTCSCRLTTQHWR